MARKTLVILAVLTVALAVMAVSTEARRGGMGGSGGTGGSGGGIAPMPNGNYDMPGADCGNYNGNYESLPGNYEISALESIYVNYDITYNGNYDGNYNGNYPLPTVAWVKSYDSGGSDRASGVATDSKDNAIVAGNSRTIKYDSTGNPFWIAAYNGNRVATDSKDNVIVAGSSTIKYDSRGNQIWTILFGGTGVAADSKDNVIVTGSSNGDYLTIKYDSDGNQLWNRTYDSGGSDSARGVAVDSHDNVIVTGRMFFRTLGWSTVHGFGHNYSYLTIKYDSDGNQVWAKTHHCGGPGGIGGDWASSIAVDLHGNVIVTGTSGGDGSYDYHTVKYDSSGNLLWTHTEAPTPDGAHWNNAYDVAVDGSGNVYVTGGSSAFRNRFYSNYIYRTIKYGPNGNSLWEFIYDADTSGIESFDSARGVAVDSKGNVYVTGESNGDYFTIKLCTEASQNEVPRHMTTRTR